MAEECQHYLLDNSIDRISFIILTSTVTIIMIMQTLMNEFSVCMSTISSELQNTRPTANTDSLDDDPICHIE
jgi:hypothetical protein